jgi:hypothetical protein
MARTQPKAIFGVHGVTPYSRTTGLPYGELRVLKGSSLSLAAELVELMGGSSKYPWAAEEGAITAEMTLSCGELPNFLFELFLGIAPTEYSAGTSGSISSLTNKNGSTIQASANGVTGVTLISGSAATLKFGKYVMKATASNAFQLYYLTGIDLGRGTDASHENDALKVGSGTFTSSVVTFASFGLQFNGSGTLAMVANDTATFEVLPAYGSAATARVGGVVTQSFPEFGALVYSQKRGNQEMLELDVFRCKGAGMPLPFEMGQFAGFELKVKCLYDDAKDGLFDMRHVAPS